MNETKTPLRVSRLTVKNYGRISAMNIEPGLRSLVVIRGPNEAGKTSALSALITALGGKTKAIDEPVHKQQPGEPGDDIDGAIIEVAISEGLSEKYRVVRSFKGDRSYLTVFLITDEQGKAKLQAGQTLLDSLVGDLSFDPLAFAKTKDRNEQTRMLLRAYGKEELYAASKQRRDSLFQQRTEVNRELKAMLARLDNDDPNEILARDIPDKMSQDAVDARLAEISEHNAHVAKVGDDINRSNLLITGALERIEQARQSIASLEQSILQQKEYIAKQEAIINNLSDDPIYTRGIINPVEVQQELDTITEHNQVIANMESERQLAESIVDTSNRADAFSKGLQAIDKDLETILTEAIPQGSGDGLSIKDGELYHNDLPFSQASGMRRLEVSCMVGMAANPTLRVMCIDEGDVADDNALDRLVKLAEQYNYSVWMTGIRIPGMTDDSKYFIDIANGKAIDAEAKTI